MKTEISNKTALIILKTSEYNYSIGGYEAIRSFNINERISYRGLNSPYHIRNNYPTVVDNFKDARKDRYEVKCLEEGIRPFGYPDKLWNEYLSDVESENHTNRCEAQDAWMYIN